MYRLEIIPEDIWTKNKQYKKELKSKWYTVYPDVLDFCEEEDLMYLFRKKQHPRVIKKVAKNGPSMIRRTQ